jgi:hypothetical protein
MKKFTISLLAFLLSFFLLTSVVSPFSGQSSDAPLTWEIVFDSPTESIQDIQAFNGALFASAHYNNQQHDGRLYRFDGTQWVDLNISSKVGHRIDLIQPLTVFNNRLFIGARSVLNGNFSSVVYSYDGSTFKLELILPGEDGYSGIEDLYVDENTLYATNGNYRNGEVWKLDLTGIWSRVGETGPGYQVRAITIYDGILYVGNGTWGHYLTKLLGEIWETVIEDGEILSLEVYDNKIFAGESGSVWTYDGETWQLNISDCTLGFIEKIDNSLWLGFCDGHIKRFFNNEWIDMGFAGEYISRFDKFQNYIYAASFDGRIYRQSGSSISTLQITTETPIPGGIVGTPYSVTLEATGGILPYAWSVDSGILPPGLELDSNSGVISGIPTVSGAFVFTIKVTDSSQVTFTKKFYFSPPPSPGISGSYYQVAVSPAPFPNPGEPIPTCSDYSLESGTLPEGLTLDSSSGIITGIPKYGGTFYFTINCVLNTNQIATKEFTIIITDLNKPPTVQLLADTSLDEGSSIEIQATGNDPDGDMIFYSWVVDNGDPYITNNSSYIFSAESIDGPSTHSITLTATDNHGSSSLPSSTTIDVLNVNPMINSISAPLDPRQVNSIINIVAGFNDPGIFDTHTAKWDWGDGIISSGSVNESNGSGAVTGSHQYSVPGVYTVKLIVVDDDGGIGFKDFRYIVIYNPEGSFVTGGGWINSPMGAYQIDPNVMGKATFGFVAKYQKGANIPSGNTEFQFQTANLNFHSDSYNWLVVAGERAMFKGVGTINGLGHYEFLLSAIDGSKNGIDKFRIKIWAIDQDGIKQLIYDNQINNPDDADPTNIIGGGSIVIHK